MKLNPRDISHPDEAKHGVGGGLSKGAAAVKSPGSDAFIHRGFNVINASQKKRLPASARFPHTDHFSIFPLWQI
jgi:hypothetical protein